MNATDVTLTVGDNSTTWQVPDGATATIDLVGVPGGVNVRFYGEDAKGRILTGSTWPPRSAGAR